MKVLVWDKYDYAMHGNQQFLKLLTRVSLESWDATRSTERIKISFLVPTERKLFRELSDVGAEISASPRKSLVGHMLWLVGAVRRERPDVILCTNHANLLVISLAAFIHRAPIVWLIKNASRSVLFDSISFATASRVLPLSSEISKNKGALLNRLYRKKIYFLPIGVSLDKFRNVEEKKSAPNDPVRVLMLAWIGRGKGVHIALDAVRQLNENGTPVTFVLAGGSDKQGSGYVKSMLKQGEKLPYVHFLDWVEDVVALLKDADIVILPSFAEGVPRSLVEAMAAARPVIGTRVGGVPSIVRHGVNGLLVDAGDVDGLAVAIRRLANNPEERQLMGRNGRQLALSEHSFETYYVRLVSHLQAVAKDGGQVFSTK